MNPVWMKSYLVLGGISVKWEKTRKCFFLELEVEYFSNFELFYY